MAQGDIIDTMLGWVMELLVWIFKQFINLAIWIINILFKLTLGLIMWLWDIIFNKQKEVEAQIKEDNDDNDDIIAKKED